MLLNHPVTVIENKFRQIFKYVVSILTSSFQGTLGRK